MKNTAGQKVRDIIRKECDSRMEIAIVTYILDKGYDVIKQITEEDINAMEGNGLMTKEFCQALVRAACRVVNECNQIEEFLPFIVNYLYVPNATMREIELTKNGMEDYEWDYMLEKFDLYDEEDAEDIDLIVLNANVIKTVKFED